ncbi:MAG: hypothetical protein ACI9KE_001916, partial [Polyangiales bacterium]
MIDESVIRACGSVVGTCRAGMQVCVGGAWSTCSGETLPTIEKCNNLDDDCDGAIDDSIERSCGSNIGICRPGTQTCTAGEFAACTGGVSSGTEVCEGMRDEDCSGAVDEGCLCLVDDPPRECGSSIGACSLGSQTCDASGTWGPCSGGVGPTPEVCNSVDDDCDGVIDGSCSGPPRIDIGSTDDPTAAGNYVVLAKAGITNATGSLLSGGNVGLSPAASSLITGFSLVPDVSTEFSTSIAVESPSRVFAANYGVPTPNNLTLAVLDMEAAYTDGASRPAPDFTNLGAGELGGRTLVPGLYKWTTAVGITND